MKRTLSAWILAAVATGMPAFADDAITFSKHVAPILQKNCQECHRTGDIAPMSLLTFEEARPWAKSIRKHVSERTMPPWFADPAHGKWKNDRSLCEADLKTITSWVDQGAKEGDPTDMPAPVAFATEDGWKYGEPELVFQYPRPYFLGKDVADEYRCFVMPIDVDQDVWLKAVEYRPDNRAVVHHFIVFIDETDSSLLKDAVTPEPGCECSMSGGGAGPLKFAHAWAPGNDAPLMPGGMASKIKRGSHLVLQIHYHNTTGADQLDQSRIALQLAHGDETIVKEPQINMVSAWQLNIAAGDPAAKHMAVYTAMKDLALGSAAPHMHYRGKSMQLFYQRPGEAEQLFLSVPRYDFNWQMTYSMEEPLKLPKGSKIRMEAIHDNSENNPFNPKLPPVEVHWGEETHNEMALAFLGVMYDDDKLNVTPEWPLRMTSNATKDGGMTINERTATASATAGE